MTSDPDWLNDLEMRVWRGWLRAVSQVDQQLTQGLKSNADMTMDDYEVLTNLSDADDHRLRMSELSGQLLHSNSRLTQRIDRLERRGFVCREKCPEDRRGTFACLTPAGFAALEAAAPQHLVDVRTALVDNIEPDELEVLARVFERINSTGASPP